GLEGTNSMASWLCQQELLMGKVKTIEEVIEVVEALTAEQLREVARRVFDNPLQMAVIGPFASDSGFRAAVSS
ncbi:MAG: insulinase family protein, partial [Candidatus Dormibacteraceae bacterium]